MCSGWLLCLWLAQSCKTCYIITGNDRLIFCFMTVAVISERICKKKKKRAFNQGKLMSLCDLENSQQFHDDFNEALHILQTTGIK